MAVAVWSSMRPVRWSPVLRVAVVVAATVAALAEAAVTVVAAAVVAAAVAAVAATVVQVVAAVAAGAVVVTVAVAAATKNLHVVFGPPLERLLREPFLFSVRGWPVARRHSGHQSYISPIRGFLGRPAIALSNSQFGSSRNNLATTPICHGITV